MPGEDRNDKDQDPASEEQSRRFACDRCRGQKLRCERRASSPDSSGSNVPCKRCARAGARCVTSPQQRMGRPRYHPHATVSVGHDAHERGSRQEAETEEIDRDHDQADSSIRVSGKRTETAMCANLVRHENMSSNYLPCSVTSMPIGGVQLDPTFDVLAYPSSPAFDNFNFNALLDTGITDGAWAAHLESPPALSASIDASPQIPSSTNMLTRNNTSNETLKRTDRASNLFTQAHDTTPAGYAVSNKRRSIRRADASERDVAPDPSALRRECITKLSGLTSDMLRDLNDLECGTVGDFPFLSMNNGDAQRSTIPNVRRACGKMLENSDRFLKILKQYIFKERQLLPPLDSLVAQKSDSEDDHPSIRRSPRPALASTSEEGTSFPGKQMSIDVTTTLAISTCYTYLVGLYEEVFSLIDRESSAHSIASEPLSILPDLHLDEFQLDSHCDLQMQILTMVASHLLSQLEACIEGAGINLARGIVPNERYKSGAGKEQGLGTAKSKRLRQVMKDAKYKWRDQGFV